MSYFATHKQTINVRLPDLRSQSECLQEIFFEDIICDFQIEVDMYSGGIDDQSSGAMWVGFKMNDFMVTREVAIQMFGRDTIELLEANVFRDYVGGSR